MKWFLVGQTIGANIAWFSKASNWKGDKVGTRIQEVNFLDWPDRRMDAIMCMCNEFRLGEPCAHVKATVQMQRSEQQFDDDKIDNALKKILERGNHDIVLQTGRSMVCIPVRPVIVQGNMYQFSILSRIDDKVWKELKLLDYISTFDSMEALHISVGEMLELWASGRTDHPFTPCSSPLHNKTSGLHGHELWTELDPADKISRKNDGWGPYPASIIAEWYMLYVNQICLTCYGDVPHEYEDGI